MKTVFKVLLIAGLVSAVVAQTPNEAELRAKKAALAAAADQAKANVLFNGQTFQFVSGQLLSGPPVKGAPYSAEVVNESIQTLADGNRIVQRTSSMQYRDAEGRERREETSAMGAIFITDPVAGARYTLHPDSQTAEKNSLPSGGTYQLILNDAFSAQTARGGGPVHIALAVPGGRGVAPAAAIRLNGAPLTLLTGDAIGAKTEQLGNMFIEGVQAQGTRTTTTIPAGDIGNDRPINIVDERWYSPDLQMTIMTRHSDPRSGETNFALKNINRSAPPPTLFEVPPDYTVNAGGGRGGPYGVTAQDAAQRDREEKLRKAGVLK